MRMLLSTVKTSKGEPVKKPGVYLGTNERTEETFVGIEHGVIECRSMNRLPPEDKWSRMNVLQMRATTWEFVPGVESQHVPVDIDEIGIVQRDEDEGMSYDPIDDEDQA